MSVSYIFFDDVFIKNVSMVSHMAKAAASKTAADVQENGSSLLFLLL